MHVLIIGGGIGGLATALSLQKAGIEATVFEAVPEIRPLGVGINMLPHAVREFTELGLQDELAAVGIKTRELVYANRHGQQIWQEDRGLHAGYNWPQFSIARGALQMILLEAARARLGDERIVSDHELTGFDQSGDQVTAHFRQRSTGETLESVTGDVLIAADGIHSVVRHHFYPDEGDPVWSSCVLWRATMEGAPFLSGRSMVMAGHEDQKFVCYPISRAAEREGRSLINWIAELRIHDQTTWRREDWNRTVDTSEFLSKYENWYFTWIKVPDVIRGATTVYEFPMVDRDPLDRWSFGRVTLLGDAAHPMYPIGSNGASQAIIDGRMIALHLATHDDPEAALQAYEAERRPPTNKIVLANRGNGPDQVMQLAEERAPDGFDDLHA
ncbi:MAG: flavin-dependent oxidoreductase, partial [Pseudomonadota bacterium]|nr:flavin-dependent oxidoreductase [Pseudomonadota bacterium]